MLEISDLIIKDDLQHIDTPNHFGESLPVLVFSYIPEFPTDESVKKTFEHMKAIIGIYRNHTSQTIRMQITSEAFDRLKDRPGVRGNGYSHIQKVLSGVVKNSI